MNQEEKWEKAALAAWTKDCDRLAWASEWHNFKQGYLSACRAMQRDRQEEVDQLRQTISSRESAISILMQDVEHEKALTEEWKQKAEKAEKAEAEVNRLQRSLDCQVSLVQAVDEERKELEAKVKTLEASILKHLQEEHLEGDRPEIDR